MGEELVNILKFMISALTNDPNCIKETALLILIILGNSQS